MNHEQMQRIRDALANLHEQETIDGWGIDLRKEIDLLDAALAAEPQQPYGWVYTAAGMNGALSRNLPKSIREQTINGKPQWEPLYTAPPAPQSAVCDRDTARTRYTDISFNEWLDDVIADNGMTVFDTLKDIDSAYAAWTASASYQMKPRSIEWLESASEDAIAPQSAQPDLLPVAWMLKVLANGKRIFRDAAPRASEEGAELWIPVYTAPPSREWQGLTMGERVLLINEVNQLDNTILIELGVSIATEAALRAKNEVKP